VNSTRPTLSSCRLSGKRMFGRASWRSWLENDRAPQQLLRNTERDGAPCPMRGSFPQKGESLMNTLLSLALTMMLAVGSAALLFAPHPFAQDTPESACTQDTDAAAPQAHEGHATVATIIQVDHQDGLLDLETEIGRVLTLAAPEDIQDLQEGDQIVVCLV